MSTCGSSPGTTTFVLKAEYPRSTTSRPSAATASYESSLGVPVTSKARARVVPQCDQYSGIESRVGPPKSSYTGTPSALAFTSRRAFSIPAIAFAMTDPGLWRVCR